MIRHYVCINWYVYYVVWQNIMSFLCSRVKFISYRKKANMSYLIFPQHSAQDAPGKDIDSSWQHVKSSRQWPSLWSFPLKIGLHCYWRGCISRIYSWLRVAFLQVDRKGVSYRCDYGIVLKFWQDWIAASFWHFTASKITSAFMIFDLTGHNL